MLVLGCSSPRPKEHIAASCLKGLPPTCSLLVLDNRGRVLIKKQGTSQQGSTSKPLQPSSLSSSTQTSRLNHSELGGQSPRSLAVTSSSKSSPLRHAVVGVNNVRNAVQLPDTMLQKQFQKLALLEAKGAGRRFTPQELGLATENFSPQMVIGEGGYSKVYRANLREGQAAAVKVLKITQRSGEELLQEVEILSNLNQENIIQLIGYCYSTDMHAVVYKLLQGSLKQNLTQLGWSERMKVAVGVAKALEHLHHSCSPPIIHRDVKSSNVLLSRHCHPHSPSILPQLSDFGAAMVQHQPQQSSATTKAFHVVGTFGYLAPEYMMYGKVDEKIDVYSYGVVLLELITGKEAIQTDLASNHESLILWARSLLSRGLCERLIDPQLNEDYDKEEMQRMMLAARLCLMHSSSRRPTMKTILKLLEEPEYWQKMQREREELINGVSFKGEPGLQRHDDDLATYGIPIVDDT